MKRRAWLIREVVQTSSMDCGPACLVAMLDGFGISASYGRLREACQTDVDGTSIDTLEEIANQLGLSAQQILIPVDHVLLQESDALPAIVVTRLPERSTHFVVVWRRTHKFVQLMDPAVGRRWVTKRRFLDDLYVHEMDLPADGWLDWARSEDMRRPLERRLRILGVDDPERLIDRALVDVGWRPIAALDAATRMVQAMVEARTINPGISAAALVEKLATDAVSSDRDDTIPAEYWSARPAHDETLVRARGAVLVQVSGRQEVPPPRSAELAAALREPPVQPWRTLRAEVMADGSWRLAALAMATILAAAGMVGEALLFRGMLDIGRELSAPVQLLGAMVALIAFLLALTLIELPLRAGTLRLGRHLEIRFRVSFLAKVFRLGVAYLRSRPASDMAERSHVIHNLRKLPTLAARITRLIIEIVFTAIGLMWIAPGSWPLVALVVVAAITPLAMQSIVTEVDLRLRTHAGGLARFYLDGLIGIVPARTHGMESALRAQHEGTLVQWARAARARLRIDVAIATTQAVLAMGCAILIVVTQAMRQEDPAGLVLFIYWALAIPMAGAELAALLREIPTHRNATLRLLEPLGALDHETQSTADGVMEHPVAIEAHKVGVVVAGHRILSELELSISPGEHVAIVGRSGAGKSTLLGLLLGWVRTSSGELRIDGKPANQSVIVSLRRQTAWVDPTVYLWNDTLAANLRYGVSNGDIPSVLGPADLEPTLARLPNGLGTAIGEAGRLVSSGEGQRIRLGRALMRQRPGLVLLDEPFRGLDHDQRRARLAVAREHWRDATLLCVTHDISETVGFPRVLVIEGGRIVEDGSPAELASQPNSRYAALVTEEAVAHAAWGRWRQAVLTGGRVQ